MSKSLLLGLGVAVGLVGAAAATPVTFTWAPTGASPSMTGGTVTANNLVVADFASATINPFTGAFSETGALRVTSFELGGSGVFAPGLNSTYGLYLTFNATGNQGGPVPGPGNTVSGPISSFSYTLWGNPTGSPTFAVSNGAVTIGNNASAFVLAYGSGGGTPADFVTLTNTGIGFLPSAHVDATFNPCTGAVGPCTADQSGFFVSPPASFVLSLEAAFTNTLTVSTLVPGAPTYLNIVGGGGNVTFNVPEPTTLMLLGMGVLSMIGAARRYS